MTHLIIQELNKRQLKTDLPELKAGYTVRVHQKIREGEKQRIQIFEGLVIAISAGNGPGRTITVRKIVAGIGVEKIFPVHSPNIAEIEVVRIGKVRRAKLYYMRDISGKAARLKEVLVSKSKKKAKLEAPVEEGEKQEDVSVVEEVAESKDEAIAAKTEDTSKEETSEKEPEKKEDKAPEEKAVEEKPEADDKKE
jgi:large subunit ribosomal protein L19